MHLTFVEADRAGKRWRLREAGLYPLKPEEVVGRRFLTYTPPQPGATPPERHPSLWRNGRHLPIPNMSTWPRDPGRGWSVTTVSQHYAVRHH